MTWHWCAIAISALIILRGKLTFWRLHINLWPVRAGTEGLGRGLLIFEVNLFPPRGEYAPTVGSEAITYHRQKVWGLFFNQWPLLAFWYQHGYAILILGLYIGVWDDEEYFLYNNSAWLPMFSGYK